MHNPSFTIVIPTYQRRDLVCRTVEVLAELSYAGDFDVLVVVDGSTDGTAGALAGLECPFALTIVEQQNGGAAHARNAGAKRATGEIILFLDDDMSCAPDLLEEHARSYRDGADAVTGEISPQRDLPEGIVPAELPSCAPGGPDLPATPFDIFTGQLSVKRDVFANIGGFDERYTAAGGYGNEDLDFGARLLAAHSVRINPRAITMHRDTATGRQVLRRARLLAGADVQFAQAHPELARELFERRGAWAPTARFLYRPIGRIPLLAPLVAAAAVGLAELWLRTPFASRAGATRLSSIAYGASYWSTVGSRLRLSRAPELR